MKKILPLLIMMVQAFANTINYAEKWQEELIMFIMQDTITAEHIETGVEWSRAKTFHFTIMNVSGFQDHSRNGGWNRGDVVQTDVPYTVEHDRDVEFLVDVADIDESNETANIQNVANTFLVEQQNPETDAYFFSDTASAAVALGAFVNDQVVGTDITISNVVSVLKAAILPIRRYKASNIRVYLSSAVMDLLEQSDKFTRQINVQAVNMNLDEGGDMIETRVTYLDGVKLVEVEDTDRFYDSFDFTDGFAPISATSRPINFLVCTVTHTLTVLKMNNIYTFLRGNHTQGDGDLYQHRAFWDVFHFPNAKTGVVDSLYANLGEVIP